MIKVVIADDQILFRSMLEQMISSDQRFEMVACAENGIEVLDLLSDNKVDLVLLDIRMPEMDGITALKKIKKLYPTIKVLMLTTFEDPYSVHEALLGGADGYLLKNMKPMVLLSAMFCAVHEMVILHREIFENGFQVEQLHDKTKFPRMEIQGVQFSKADIQVIRLIAEGKTNKEIAQIMSYSEGTIKNKVSSLLSKTGANDRTQISIYAIKNKLI